MSGLTSLRASVDPPDAVGKRDLLRRRTAGVRGCRAAVRVPMGGRLECRARTRSGLVVSLATGGRIVRVLRTKGLAFTDAVDVDAVQVTVTVTDESGQYVPKLPRSAFRVFEDEEPAGDLEFRVGGRAAGARRGRGRQRQHDAGDAEGAEGREGLPGRRAHARRSHDRRVQRRGVPGVTKDRRACRSAWPPWIGSRPGEPRRFTTQSSRVSICSGARPDDAPWWCSATARIRAATSRSRTSNGGCRRATSPSTSSRRGEASHTITSGR